MNVVKTSKVQDGCCLDPAYSIYLSVSEMRVLAMCLMTLLVSDPEPELELARLTLVRSIKDTDKVRSMLVMDEIVKVL